MFLIFFKKFMKYLFTVILLRILKHFFRILSQHIVNHTAQTMHVLMRLIENWKRSLEQNKLVGAVFMDLSKVFDSLLSTICLSPKYKHAGSLMTISLLFSHSWKRENKILKLEIHLAFFKYYCLVCLKDFYNRRKN